MALTLTRNEAELVLQGVGFRLTDKWDDETLEKKLLGIHDVVDDDTELGDEDADLLFRDVLNEIAKGEKGQIIVRSGGAEPTGGEDEESQLDELDVDAPAETRAEEPEPEKDKPKPKKRGRKPKKAAAADHEPEKESTEKAEPTAEVPKAKKPMAEKDKFGLRVGSKGSLIFTGNHVIIQCIFSGKIECGNGFPSKTNCQYRKRTISAI